MKRLLMILALVLMPCAAFAQTIQAPAVNPTIVVQTCGTAPTNFPTVDAGNPARAPIIVDANGNICTAASGTGTQNVNVTRVGGAAVPNAGSGALAVVGITSTGTTVVGGPVIVGGSSGGNSAALTIDSTGGGGVVIAAQSGATTATLQMATTGAGVGGVKVSEVSPITNNVTDPNIGTVAINISSATVTQIVALSGTKKIYVTGYGMTVGTTAASAQTVQFVYGTGANCAAGQTVMTGGLSGATEVTLVGDNVPSFFSEGNGTGLIIGPTAAGNALCVKTTGTQAVGGSLAYVQFFYGGQSDGAGAGDMWAIPEEFSVWHSKRLF